MFKYRIVEAEKFDGSIIYILEQSQDGADWTSVWRDADLSLIKEAKQKREQGDIKKRRVID